MPEPNSSARTVRPRAKSRPAPLFRVFLRILGAAFVITLIAGLSALNWDSDEPLSAAETTRLRDYYATAYQAGESGLSAELEEIYVKIARQAATSLRVKETLEEFVQTRGLANGAALDVGAGRGYLQDVVSDYTGLDISSSARRFFHKPFVLGSATSMPFEDNRFDLAWSIWVLEHVPNPEQALSEMRRVVKDGGVLYLMPAWNCPPWLSEGYEVRPYAELTARQKVLKATLRFRRMFRELGWAAAAPMRLVRANLEGGPSRLHYTKLQPNYEKYWQPDSDALNELDRYEMLLWFLSRGDECLNCSTNGPGEYAGEPRLIIRVRKPAAGRVISSRR